MIDPVEKLSAVLEARILDERCANLDEALRAARVGEARGRLRLLYELREELLGEPIPPHTDRDAWSSHGTTSDEFRDWLARKKERENVCSCGLRNPGREHKAYYPALCREA